MFQNTFENLRDLKSIALYMFLINIHLVNLFSQNSGIIIFNEAKKV